MIGIYPKRFWVGILYLILFIGLVNPALAATTFTLHKIVITDDGGTAGVNDFGLTINGTRVNSGQTVSVTTGVPFLMLKV
jgi:hypothetical protein